jgi:hypothetical protein
MSFFHFASGGNDDGEERWTVSPNFWIYWAVTIPVTALTIGVWVLYQRVYNSRGGPVVEFENKGFYRGDGKLSLGTA